MKKEEKFLKCKFCGFFVSYGLKDDTGGECRMRAPYNVGWPQVDEGQWCGDFKLLQAETEDKKNKMIKCKNEYCGAEYDPMIFYTYGYYRMNNISDCARVDAGGQWRPIEERKCPFCGTEVGKEIKRY